VTRLYLPRQTIAPGVHIVAATPSQADPAIIKGPHFNL